MNDRSVGASSVTVRHEPVQARAAQRIEALLDAAAAVVVDHGIEHLTTALVAERAGASIGTVYRYFPDRVAVLVALAERNFERMRAAIERELVAPHESWPVAMEAIVGAVVDTFRSVPSFRALRSGEGLDLGPQDREPIAPQFVVVIADYLQERWEVDIDDSHREHLELAIGGLDALVTYAFLHDADGDPRYLAMALQVAREHVEPIFAAVEG